MYIQSNDMMYEDCGVGRMIYVGEMSPFLTVHAFVKESCLCSLNAKNTSDNKVAHIQRNGKRRNEQVSLEVVEKLEGRCFLPTI